MASPSAAPAELARCAALQADELLALRHILPAAALHALGDARLRLVVAPRLPQRTQVVVLEAGEQAGRRPRRSRPRAGDAVALPPAGEGDVPAAGEIEAPVAGPSSPRRATTLQLAHLSPLTLTLALPPLYPLHAPPAIAALSAPWLPAGSAAHAWLLESLVAQWHEAQAEILFTWADWLAQGLWEGTSPFATPEGLRLEEKRGTGLVSRLLAYEKIATKEAFEGERYGCGICLEERAGTKCVRLEGCGHIFCQECLSGYLGSMIVEGYHRQASSCPDPSCTKARVELENTHSSSIQPTAAAAEDDVGTIKDKELLPLVGEEMLGRLGWLRSKAEAEADPTAVVCPRQGCHAIARMNPSDAGTSYESMRECPKCGFTVCAYCLKVWHGRSPCSLASSSALVQEYQSHEPGSVERLKMEQRFGRANLERLVRTEMEEQANREWMEANAKKCPSCAVSIELAFGCHHMTCGKCRTHFCFLCSTRLNPLEPYRHFNTPGKPCYQRLFPNMPHVLDGGAPMGPLGEVNIDDVLAWEAAEL